MNCFTKPPAPPVQTLPGMDATPPASTIADLFSLTLVDGLKTQSGSRDLVYRQVKLRETNVNDERAATQMAERVVMVGGTPKLLVSEAEFRYALTLRHVQALEGDGGTLSGALLDLDLFGRLSSHDLGLIEQRVFLITMAAELRYGAISQEQFDALLRGEQPASTSPQPVGQAESAAAPGAQSQPGPALLASFAGGPAGGPPARDGD